MATRDVFSEDELAQLRGFPEPARAELQKPGRGDALRELAAKLTEQSTDVESWIICKEDDDSDTLWAFEFCMDDETLALHESNQDVEKSHEAIIELLAEPPVRIVVRPTAASMQLLRP